MLQLIQTLKESLADSDDDNAKLLLEIIEIAHQENQENLWKDLEESIGRLDLDYVVKKSDKYINPAITFLQVLAFLKSG